MKTVSLQKKRISFGEDAAAYQSARPPYPATVYDQLMAHVPLSGAHIFEIGPGTGQATRTLLAHMPAELKAIEPDTRLCAYLEGHLAPTAPELSVVPTSWEDAPIETGRYDLGIAATAFHWLPQTDALGKVHQALKPGGWWAMWWNVFGDPDEPDAFHQKASPLFAQLGDSQSWQQGQLPFALDRSARLSDLEAAGFQDMETSLLRWSITMTAAQVCALAATFSQVITAEAVLKKTFLNALAQLVDHEFGGTVERRFMTALYMARRPPNPVLRSSPL